MYPIRFEPIYQDYVWGGTRIAEKYHRNLSKTCIAESWEISDRKEAMSVVTNGPLKGKTLHELVVEMGEDLLGVGQKWDRFPLLLKIIDAKENLSVQVHPNETMASRLNGEAKTEMWVALDEGSVYAGVKKGTTEKEFFDAIESNEVEQVLEKIELKKGETVYVPGGRVHAICKGTLLYEIQQNSNTTYRLYDWGRKGRQLHLKEGREATLWSDHSHPKMVSHHLSSDMHHQIISLVSSPFFVVERIDVFDQQHFGAIPKTFQIFFCLEGSGTIAVDSVKEPFLPGMTYLVPAACKSIEFTGKFESLRIRFP